MDIVEFSPDLLPALTRMINEHIRFIPPGWTITEHQTALILKNNNLWGTHYPDEWDSVVNQTAFIVDNGNLVAGAQWGYVNSENRKAQKNRSDVLTIQWILSLPGYGEHLKALLDKIIEYSRLNACDKISFSRFSFGVGWLGIPIIWTHIIEALSEAGFKVSSKWRIITINNTDESYPLSKPPVDNPRLKWRINEKALEYDLEAYKDAMMIGNCEVWGIPLHFKSCPGFSEWITQEYIGVNDSYQRKGLARFLFSEQMRFHNKRGIKKVVFWTETDNLPALKFSESFESAEFGPECWDFEKY